MNHKKKLIYIVTCVLIFVAVRLFCGVYIHDEFGEEHIFIKHRPTWKWSFYSPQGQSDLQYSDMTPDQQMEQDYFNEFVRKQEME